MLKEILVSTYMVALPTLLSYIVWLLKQSSKNRDASIKGVMLLIKIQIIEYHNKYCELMYIPSYVMQNVLELYDVYKTWDSNGVVKEMVEEIKELEITDKRRYGHETA